MLLGNMPSKYIALIIVLIILLIGYCFTSFHEKKQKGRKGKSKSKNRRGGGRATKADRASKSRSEKPKSTLSSFFGRDEEPDDDDEHEEDESGVEADARELYNRVHERLCQGMQSDEFEEVAGDMAGGIAFIELKQMYNQAIDNHMDPMQAITVDDYVRILQKESD